MKPVRLCRTDVDVACECGDERAFPNIAGARRWARLHFRTCEGLGGVVAMTATVSLQPVSRPSASEEKSERELSGRLDVL